MGRMTCKGVFYLYFIYISHNQLNSTINSDQPASYTVRAEDEAVEA